MPLNVRLENGRLLQSTEETGVVWQVDEFLFNKVSFLSWRVLSFLNLIDEAHLRGFRFVLGWLLLIVFVDVIHLLRPDESCSLWQFHRLRTVLDLKVLKVVA